MYKSGITHHKQTHKYNMVLLFFLKIQIVYFNKAATGKITNSLNKEVIFITLSGVTLFIWGDTFTLFLNFLIMCTMYHTHKINSGIEMFIIY